jgi:hypothetical protein
MKQWKRQCDSKFNKQQQNKKKQQVTYTRKKTLCRVAFEIWFEL